MGKANTSLFHAPSRKGLNYTQRQLDILNDDIPLGKVKTTELIMLMRRAEERADDMNYEIAKSLYEAKIHPNEYMPILEAFLAEMRLLADGNPNVPSKLIEYMLGRYDFYKVITDDRKETTRVEAINIAGTLNRPANGHRSIVDVARLRLPTRFYHMGMVPGSDNKVEIVCDEGWTLTMRIHNASSRIEPSLKFDVQLVSLPASVHAQVEPW